MRRLPLLAIALLTLCSAVAPPAAAHAAGAQPITKQGWFILSPPAPGTSNNSTFHAYLSDLGFPIGIGDTLQVKWTSNDGAGPPINFEIHTHEHGWTTYYNATGVALDTQWRVPNSNETFMVYFVNPTAFAANVSYSFVLIAPTDLTPLIVLPLAIGGAIGWFMWLRAAPPQEEGTSAGPEAGGPVDRTAEGANADEAFQAAAEAAEARNSDETKGGP